MTDTVEIDAKTKAKKSAHIAVSAKLVASVGVEVEAVLGSARMSVAELTALGPGALVELDSPLNTLVELRLNQVPVAHGELVAVGDKFGVRLTRIVQWPD